MCPDELRVDVPLNRKQWGAVRSLHRIAYGSHFPLKYSSADYGRVAQKVESQARALQCLGKAAESLCTAFGGYFPRPSTHPAFEPGPLYGSFDTVGVLDSKPETPAMPIVAERIKMPRPPAFRPQSFMDSSTRSVYDAPLSYARVPEPGCEEPARVNILATERERVKLLKALAQLEPLPWVPPHRLS